MMQGRRINLADHDYEMDPGDYGKALDEGLWYCRPPGVDSFTGGLKKHRVTEHDDGTITVSPSIVQDYSNGTQWHGYLERGVWREV